MLLSVTLTRAVQFRNTLTPIDSIAGRDTSSIALADAAVELPNLKRLSDELEWFTLKYDFRNADKPWGNSRDAVERSINKLMGACVGDEAKMPAHND